MDFLCEYIWNFASLKSWWTCWWDCSASRMGNRRGMAIRQDVTGRLKDLFKNWDFEAQAAEALHSKRLPIHLDQAGALPVRVTASVSIFRVVFPKLRLRLGSSHILVAWVGPPLVPTACAVPSPRLPQAQSVIPANLNDPRAYKRYTSNANWKAPKSTGLGLCHSSALNISPATPSASMLRRSPLASATELIYLLTLWDSGIGKAPSPGLPSVSDDSPACIVWPFTSSVAGTWFCIVQDCKIHLNQVKSDADKAVRLKFGSRKWRQQRRSSLLRPWTGPRAGHQVTWAAGRASPTLVAAVRPWQAVTN